MQMIIIYVWTGLLSTVGQHASGDLITAFPAPIFNLPELSFSYLSDFKCM